MSNKFTSDDDALLNELGIEVETGVVDKFSAREKRIIEGFNEILKFYEDTGRPPSMSEDADVFEKIYAIRLYRMQRLEDCRTLLASYDKFDLLGSTTDTDPQLEKISDDELLDELGVDLEAAKTITKLKHVKPKAKLASPDEIASRTSCPDFHLFKPLFSEVREDIRLGKRNTPKYQHNANISEGEFFIIGGQMAYVAEMGAEFTNSYGRRNSRMRVIFDNGTQTEGMLMRSFQRALHKNENSRRVEASGVISLFSDQVEDDDIQSGYIYVLRSMSNHPLVIQNRDLVHKIGVTGGDVRKRVANAKYDPTFLMADVEIVAEYQLANVHRVRLEALVHKFFSQVQLNIGIKDRFGKNVNVREWFLAPLFAIDQMIDKLKTGELSDYYYDKDTASIQKIDRIV